MLRWHRFGLATLLATGPAGALAAQSDGGMRLGIEAQAYPAGLISVARLEQAVGGGSAVGVVAGYNLARRGDFGEHDDERGGGFGFGILTTQRFGRGASGFYAGGRIDLWWLDIDWEDRTPARRGATTVTVVQPTARVGHGWSLAAGRLRIEAGIALGVEVNVRTRGEAVGDGTILLGNLGVLLRP